MALPLTRATTRLKQLIHGQGKVLSVMHPATAALARIHYLLSPGIFPDQYLTCGLFFWLMAWLLLARRRLGTDVWALAVLAVVTLILMTRLKPKEETQ